VDSEGTKRSIGAWHIEGTDIYHDGAIQFQPVRVVNKMIKYVTEDEGKTWNFAGESVYFNDFRDEILDSTGGVAFGRRFGKELRSMSLAEQEAQALLKKAAGTYADAFGLVTIGTAEPMLVVLRVRGGKLKVLTDAFNSIPKGKRPAQYSFALETYQEVDEKTKKTKAYWSLRVTPDMSKILPTTPLIQLDADIAEYIRECNHKVLQEHKKNRARLDESTRGTTAKVVNTVIDNDLNDDLPF
jgi:hypothetical protein